MGLGHQANQWAQPSQETDARLSPGQHLEEKQLTLRHRERGM